MAIDDYRKSGVSFKGVTKDNYDMAKKLNDLGKEQADIYKQQGAVLGTITGAFGNLNKAAEDYKQAMEGNLDLSEEQVEKLKEAVEKSEKLGDAITDLAPGLVSMAQGAQAFAASMTTALGPIGLILATVYLLYKAISGVAEAIADVRKDLGVSAIEAVKIKAALFGISKVAALSGISAEEINESFSAARDNLGLGTREALGLSLALSKTAMRTGQTADNLTTTLSIMESVSSASREALLAQIETTGEMIQQASLAPGDIFKDIAENAEFFATSMKAGTNNVMKTAIEARKLGLNLSTVAKISESLLDFESSIEKQMEASVLLGRQLNLDKARQLSFMDDQEGMMREILRQVGGEAEFERLKGFQRRALADAVGVDVAELAKLARQREGAATGVTVAKTTEEKSLSVAEESLIVLKDVRNDITGVRSEAKKTNQELAAGG